MRPRSQRKQEYKFWALGPLKFKYRPDQPMADNHNHTHTQTDTHGANIYIICLIRFSGGDGGAIELAYI